jgi:hypothetical protein
VLLLPRLLLPHPHQRCTVRQSLTVVRFRRPWLRPLLLRQHPQQLVLGGEKLPQKQLLQPGPVLQRQQLQQRVVTLQLLR